MIDKDCIHCHLAHSTTVFMTQVSLCALYSCLGGYGMKKNDPCYRMIWYDDDDNIATLHDDDDSYDVEAKEHMGCWSVCQTLLSHAHNSTSKSQGRQKMMMQSKNIYYNNHHRNRDHFHQGGRLPNVCVSHAANSSLTGLLSSHLGLQYTLPIVFLPFCVLYFFHCINSISSQLIRTFGTLYDCQWHCHGRHSL